MNRGIALLELMLATAILGIALIALGVAAGRCVHGLAQADHVQEALDVAEMRLAEWKNSISEQDEIQISTFDGARTVLGRAFAWRQTLEDSEDPKILKSTLTVSWVEGGKERQKSFVSLVARSKTR